MRKINKLQYKMKVLQVLRREDKPIWVSDLYRKHGLPDVSLNEKGNARPTQIALKELEKEGKIHLLRPRYYKPDSQNPRRKISLARKGNPRKYFEVELMDQIEDLKTQVKNLTNNNLTQQNMFKNNTLDTLPPVKKKHSYKGRSRKDTGSIFDLIMNQQKISQDELAKRLGIHVTSISKIRHKKMSMSPRIRQAVEAYLREYNLERHQPADTAPVKKNLEQETPEESLLKELNHYLSIKKKEMEKEIEDKIAEAIYYKNLAEKQATEIEELKGKADSKKFLGISWD